MSGIDAGYPDLINRTLAKAARDVERFAGDPGGVGRRQEHGRRRDVLRLADAAERRLRLDLLAEIALGNAGARGRLRFRSCRG